MDIKEIQEQAYKKGFADGQATLGAEFMCKKIVSCEDASTKYLDFPDGLRLIFREGQYVGWYVCEGHEESEADGKDTDVPTKHGEVKGVEIDQFNKWIPVTERLPEVGEVVLACGKRHATSGMFQGVLRNKPNMWHWKGNTLKEVTHWMPLPEPPKGE